MSCNVIVYFLDLTLFFEDDAQGGELWMGVCSVGLWHTAVGLPEEPEILHCQSWLKHGTGAFAPLPNWPIFPSYGTVFVEAVPPTCSAPVVRIKLAA